MGGQADPSAIDRDLAELCQALQRSREGRRRKARLELQPQPLAPDALEIRALCVKSSERLRERFPQSGPSLRREREDRALAGEAEEAETVGSGGKLLGAERPIAREISKVDVSPRIVEQSRQRRRRLGNR